MNYDERYSNVNDYFGKEPEGILKEYYYKLDKSKPILDIGAGQGRNIFFLARKGYEVDAIDESKVSIEIISAIAKKENLLIETYNAGFETFDAGNRKYSGILLIGLMPLISLESIKILQKKIDIWTEKESLVFVTTFSTDDPSYSKTQSSKEWEMCGKNSFKNKDNGYRTYFEEGEILGLFPNYKLLYQWEGMSKAHKHGTGELHQHGMIEAVFQRK